jgi:glycosyltransferase involved in cell wall biosynthesis
MKNKKLPHNPRPREFMMLAPSANQVPKKEIQLFKQQLDDGLAAFAAGNQKTYHAAVESTGRALDQMCKSGFVEIALALETLWYQTLVKKIESDKHYADCFKHHTSSMWSAGRRMSPGPVMTGDPNCIAFVAHNSVLLGHTEVMLLMMEDWKRRYPHLRLIFVGLTPCQPNLLCRLSAIGVEAITPTVETQPLALAAWLRKTLVAENAGTAIWLTLPLWVHFLFGYRVAGRQVFWSLKFHAVHLGEEVTHIGMTKQRDGIVEIHDKPWLAFQPPLAVQINERDTKTRTNLRGIYNDKFLFSTLARDEKFNSPKFVIAVAQILKRCPDSVFMFTGRQISPVMENIFVEYGVTDQAIFIGWVDTELYANLVDCFLETFPFGCGITGMQALSHGTPVMSLWDKDTLPTFYFQNPEQATRFHSNWVVSTNEEDYIYAATNCFRRWQRGEERKPTPREKIISLDSAKYEKFFELVTGA